MNDPIAFGRSDPSYDRGTLHHQRRRAAAAYLYRYLIPALPATPDAAVFLQQVVRNEVQRGLASEIELIGRRIVAMPIAE